MFGECSREPRTARATNGALSLVAATTIDRRKPSAPSELRTKSPTSRPRSPINPTMLTSALICRQSMPSSVLLPTPLPAKSRMRCPLPSGNIASIDRTPVSITRSIGRREKGGGGGACNARVFHFETSARRRSGVQRHRRSHAPRDHHSRSPPRHAAASTRARQVRHRPVDPKGADSARPSRKPSTSSIREWSDSGISNCVPTAGKMPATSTSWPTTCVRALQASGLARS